MKQFTFVVDIDRCIGCKGCQVACKLENTVALGPGRNKVCTVGPNGVYPDLQMYFLTTMCQQCENPTCVQVCPTGACYKDEDDGVIRIDRASCIGCGSCAGSALHYGDINDPDSAVSKLLAETDPKYIHTLRDEGNGPTVRYILRSADWVDVLPQDCVEHSVWKKGGRKA